MPISFRRLQWIPSTAFLLTIACTANAQPAAPPPPSPADTPPPATSPQDDYWPADWPREFSDSNKTQFIVYEPQLESWNGHALTGRSAVAVKPDQAKEATYGVVSIQATTTVDKENRVVTFEDLTVTKASFPTAANKGKAWQTTLENEFHGVVETMALDRLEAQLKTMDAVQVADSKPVKNEPPKIIFSKVPAIMVHIDGKPVWKAVAGTDLQQVLNTRVLLLKSSDGALYLHVFDGWMTAASLDGDWSHDKNPPSSLQKVLTEVEKEGNVDLLQGTAPKSNDDQDNSEAPQPPSLSKTVPVIYVETEPATLIVTDGAPDYSPIDGTKLLYVSNTTGDVFEYIDDDTVYVLISGRWFSASSEEGPWTYVPGDKLPADFASIPDHSDKENVKASVPGTEQSKEAVIANSVPQTAHVDKTKVTSPSPDYDGKPQLEPIEDTSLHYVKNASLPVIEVSPDAYYMVDNGIWFTASSLDGPWSVATSVPPDIYTIPTSSPLHYVTYVYVYGAQNDTVYVGYTPGYYGTVVSNNVVVYGTGYVYTPWIGSVWYGPPVTYGYGAGMVYSPWAGWAFAFGMGWAWGAATAHWGWGPYPYWGPYHYPYSSGAIYGPHGGGAVWGPGGWAGSTGNVYHRWGDSQGVTRSTGGYNAWTGNAWRGQSGVSYNSRTGRVSAGQRGVAENAYTGNYAAGKRVATTTPGGSGVVAGRGVTGNVYSGNYSETSYVRGQQGAIAKQGNNTYVGNDNNVYKKSSDGSWSKYDSSSGGWNSVPQSQVNQAQQTAKSDAQQRSQSASRNLGTSNFSGFQNRGNANLNDFSNSRSFGNDRAQGFRSAGGFGGARGGAFRGGGFRGGFRR